MDVSKKLLSIIILILIVISFMGSCKKAEKERIVLPPTSILTARSTWGVVKSNFLRLRERPSKQAHVLIGMPKGIVVEILSKTEIAETIDKETAFWYRINFDGLFGWVFGAYIEVFSMKTKAEEFSRDL